MTIPGLADKADDKEKLVTKVDVTTIMPNRERLIKIRKRRHILRLIISLALLLLLLSTLFLTICYVKKIGPFKRIFRGRCAVGSERHNQHKVYESFEITDDYAFINVPKFHLKWGVFQSVKTLHVFKKKLTVIQYNGVCFVRPMLSHQGLQKDWYERIGHLHNPIYGPNQFTHIHWKMTHRPFSNEYLRKYVHSMAAAMCLSRPVYNLRFYVHSLHDLRRTCFTKCENCPVSRQFVKWENINGKYCGHCHCRPASPVLKSSNQVDANCKTIRCENRCNGKKYVGCVQCRCADLEVAKGQETPSIVISKVRVNPLSAFDNNNSEKHDFPINVDNEKANMPNNAESPLINKVKLNPSILLESDSNKDKLPMMQGGNSGPLPNGLAPAVTAPVTAPVTDRPQTDGSFFRDLSRVYPAYRKQGLLIRNARSAKIQCQIVAEIFEGYTPLDDPSNLAVDYIHNC